MRRPRSSVVGGDRVPAADPPRHLPGYTTRPLLTSSTTSISATTITARNTATGRLARPAAARPAYQPSGSTTTAAATAAMPGPRRRPGRAEDQRERSPRAAARRRPPRDPAGAEPVRQAAYAGAGVVGQVGQRVGEVRAAAEQRAGRDQPDRRRRRARAAPAPRTPAAARTTPGTAATESGGELQRPVVEQRADTSASAIASAPAGQRRTAAPAARVATAATTARRSPTVRAADRAGGDRLVGAPDRRVPAGVEPVVDPADRELAGQHGRGDRGDARPRVARRRGEQGRHRGDGDGRLRMARPDQRPQRRGTRP